MHKGTPNQPSELSPLIIVKDTWNLPDHILAICEDMLEPEEEEEKLDPEEVRRQLEKAKLREVAEKRKIHALPYAGCWYHLRWLYNGYRYTLLADPTSGEMTVGLTTHQGEDIESEISLCASKMQSQVATPLITGSPPEAAPKTAKRSKDKMKPETYE
ncbi:hypothetical protein H0H87_012801 [Tephrocybe sp. NHM501043]|nr:hypothetical protein H0H87_012801 [Tephrocybe sp. NHM501043]